MESSGVHAFTPLVDEPVFYSRSLGVVLRLSGFMAEAIHVTILEIPWQPLAPKAQRRSQMCFTTHLPSPRTRNP